jgi:hypothetical protein
MKTIVEALMKKYPDKYPTEESVHEAVRNIGKKLKIKIDLDKLKK